MRRIAVVLLVAAAVGWAVAFFAAAALTGRVRRGRVARYVRT